MTELISNEHDSITQTEEHQYSICAMSHPQATKHHGIPSGICFGKTIVKWFKWSLRDHSMKLKSINVIRGFIYLPQLCVLHMWCNEYHTVDLDSFVLYM